MNNVLSEKLAVIAREALSQKMTEIACAVMQNGGLVAAAAVGTQNGQADRPAKTSDLYNIG